MRARLTRDLIASATGPCEIWDTRSRGLVLRVRASGCQTYVVVYGRGKKVTLGRARDLTIATARELARGVHGDVAHGKDPRAERRKRRAGTLRQFIAEHYAPWLTVERKTGTDAIKRLERFGALLGKPLHELSTWHVEQWKASRRRAGIAPATIARDLDDLHAALTKAIVWHVIDVHPLRDLERVKLDPIGRLRYLRPEERVRLDAALRARDDARRAARRRYNAWREAREHQALPPYGRYTDHLTPIVELALHTGLRRGELFALRWADVDLVEHRLTVRAEAAKSGLTRYLPLNRTARAVLLWWRRSVPWTTDADDPVFPGPGGEPMTTLKTAWMKVAKAARLKDFRFHDLRHTFASNLVLAGVDLNTVRELLGHRDIKMTLRYAHLAPEHTAAAVAKLTAK